MNLSLIDWLIVCVPLIVIGWVTWYCKRYTKSVADFLAASRCAGRYLLCVAGAEAGYGVISTIAGMEVFQKAGFTLTWWTKLTLPVGMLLGLFGFVSYRFRETRALTLAQFFEIRYNKTVRFAAGLLMFASGVVNFGIFPGVSALYFVYFCGFPESLAVGPLHVPTFAIIMVLYLAVTLWMTLSGGQLTILVTDSIEGILAFSGGVVIIITYLVMFSWTDIVATLSARPPGQSMLNPFDTGQVKDFNVWYILIGIVVSIYGTRAWQGNQGFFSSARTPQEARMGGVLGMWRGYGAGAISILGVACAMTFLYNPSYVSQSAEVHQIVNGISNPQVQGQMRIPVAMAHFLPTGIKGLVCMSMIFLLLANSGSYMHSWGSILIQDVLLPFRKTQFTPKQHLALLRWSIVGVAVFGFFFSLLFRQTDYILMFFALTGALYTAGAGALILGGLYWRRGTAAGALTALGTGMILAVLSFVLQNQWTNLQPWLLTCSDAELWRNSLTQNAAKCPLNGQILGLITSMTALASYVLVSLLTCREPFNMERMLHRGAYAVKDESAKPKVREKFRMRQLIGLDSNYSQKDRWIAGSVFWYGMTWFGIILTGTIWNFIHPWPVKWWVAFWHWYVIILPLGITVVTTVWFSIGAGLDLRQLFRDLRVLNRNEHDDGTVKNHRNLDEITGRGK